MRRPKQNPRHRWRGFLYARLLREDQGAEDEAADEAAEDTALETAELAADDGASEEDGAADDDGAAEEDGAAEDEEAADEDEDEGAADDEGAALELTTAELDGATGFTGVGVPRLKIQMRPMMTITATMMMIQVLRFIVLDLFEVTRPGS
jgi:hypothetical protein